MTEKIKQDITISVISHNQKNLVESLLKSLERQNTQRISKIIITSNTNENLDLKKFSINEKIIWIKNTKIKGFGENHNNAFKQCDTKFFCILNPDIIFKSDVFDTLVNTLIQNELSLISPLVTNEVGQIEDNSRFFPTPLHLLKKFFSEKSGVYISKEDIFFPDWIGGMFMLFDSNVYNDLEGFDESFFLYYEDVDICLRAWKKNFKVGCYSKVSVIHNARRSSRKKLNYLIHHLKSIFMFYYKHLGRFPR